MGKPFVDVNWTSGFDEPRRPILTPGKIGGPENSIIKPGLSATNWYPASYSPNTGLFYIAAWERPLPLERPTPAYAAVRAFDPRTGSRKWEFIRKDALF